jgi:hypothetical protein
MRPHPNVIGVHLVFERAGRVLLGRLVKGERLV